MSTIHAGTVFQVSPPIKYKWSFYAVLTDPAGTPPKVIMVRICRREYCADAKPVILDEDDHVLARSPVAVEYATARPAPARALEQQMGDGLARHSDLRPDVLERIQRGLLASTHTEKDVRRDCNKIWGSRFNL